MKQDIAYTSNDLISPEEGPHALHFRHVPESYRDKLHKMLRELCTMWDRLHGDITATENRSDLITGALPIAQLPYRAGPAAPEEEQFQVDMMLRTGVIEHVQSHWASSTAMGLTSDGTLQFSVDYRWLNAVTVWDTHPIPHLGECIDSMGDTGVLIALDANKS